MVQFEDVLETILEEYARRDSEGEFDTWEETDAFVKEKAEVLLAYVKAEPVSIWHDASEETPTQGSNILMVRKEEKDTNYPPIAGCFHGTNSRLDGRNWGYYNGFCYNEIEPPVKWAYIDDILKLSNVQRTGKDCDITGIKSKHAEGKLKECIESITEESLTKARKQLEEESVSEKRREVILNIAHELANRAELISDKFPKSTLIAVAIDMAEGCDSHPIEEPLSKDLEVVIQRACEETRLTKAKNGHPFFMEEDFKLGFYNAVQWHRNQGITKDAIIGMATEEILINLSQKALDELGADSGDKVIVQIRKKEE